MIATISLVIDSSYCRDYEYSCNNNYNYRSNYRYDCRSDYCSYFLILVLIIILIVIVIIVITPANILLNKSYLYSSNSLSNYNYISYYDRNLYSTPYHNYNCHLSCNLNLVPDYFNTYNS